MKYLLAICLFFCPIVDGIGCSRFELQDTQSKKPIARTKNQEQATLRRFLERAREDHWYLVGGSVYRSIGSDFEASIVLKDPKNQKTNYALMDGQHFKSASFSTDGSFFAAVTRNPTSNPNKVNPHLVVLNQHSQTVFEDLALTNVNQKGPRTLSAFRWSPNGGFLAFAQGGHLWVLDLKTQKKVSVTDDHQRDLTFSAPSWGPDSIHLAYENMSSQVVVLNRLTGEKRVMAQGRFPQWSPDGSKIVFREKSGEVSIFFFPNQSSQTIFKLRLHHPHYLWSPDSQYLFLDQKIHKSFKSNYFVYSFVDHALIDLRVKYGTLKDHLIQPMPEWFERQLSRISQ